MVQWAECILGSDITIVNLDESCPDELEIIVKTLKQSHFKENKIFIIITTLMTWSKVD